MSDIPVRFPDAVWDPISGRSSRVNRPVRLTLHTAWADSADIYGPNKGPGQTYAHFFNPTVGLIRQHQELDRWSYADLDANGTTVSMEHQDERRDMPFSESQMNNAAAVFAFLVQHYNVPNRIATWDNTSGLAWHRLGVQGNFGAFNRNDMTTWSRAQTGQRWSTAFGKTCPTDPRIRQIPEIYRRAQVILGGGSLETGGGGAAPSPKPTPTPKPKSDPKIVRIQRNLNKYAKAGLVVDGINGPVTRNWINWTKELQRALPQWRGVPKLLVDGDYGAVTSNAVRIVQLRNGLFVDGVAGHITINFMRSHGSKVSHRPKNRP